MISIIPEPYNTYIKLGIATILSIILFWAGYHTADRTWTIKTDKLKIDSAQRLQEETDKVLESERAKKALADFIETNYNQEVTKSHELQNHIDTIIVANNGLRDKWSRGCGSTNQGANTVSSVHSGGIIAGGESRLSVQLSTALSRDYGRAERFRKRFAAVQAWAKQTIKAQHNATR